MSKRVVNLFPGSRSVFREEDPNAIVKYAGIDSRNPPRSEAAWSHHVHRNSSRHEFHRNSSRLILSLDLSNEATEVRNKLKRKYLHSWGSFSDTRFALIDPLPDRMFYIAMYKDLLNRFCTSSPPAFPISSKLNLFSSDDTSIVSGLTPRYYPGGLDEEQTLKKVPKQPTKHNLLIVMGFDQSSVIHKLRNYFMQEFAKLPNKEVQYSMKRLEKERVKVWLPLGFSTDHGLHNAERELQNIVNGYKGTNGLHLGNAVGLSLWRWHFEGDPQRVWAPPVLTDKECLFSRAFEGVPKQPSFVSIAPENQLSEKIHEGMAAELEPEAELQSSGSLQDVHGREDIE